MNCSDIVTSSVIDLTTDPKDHLTALPSELQHLIIDYLYPTHDPDKAFHEPEDESGDERGNVQRAKSAAHPLDYLAATSRSLRREIMAWCRVFLTKHDDITKYKPLKTAQRQARRNLLRGRGGLLTWSEKNCVFCGKKSSRSAILMNGLRCCASCDVKQWPEKITKTKAKKEYRLKDHHLLPGKDFTPSLARMLAKHPGGLPKLRYGTYISSNVATTMFLRREVEALATFAHGDLKDHLEKKQAARNKQRRLDDEDRETRGDSIATDRILALRERFSIHDEDPMLSEPTIDFQEELLHEIEEIGILASEASSNLEFVDLESESIMRTYEPFGVAALC